MRRTFDESDNQAGLEEDELDLQNMTRIAQDGSNLLKKAQIARDLKAKIAREATVKALEHPDNSQAVMDSTGDDDDDLDVVFNAEADEEYDLDGNL